MIVCLQNLSEFYYRILKRIVQGTCTTQYLDQVLYSVFTTWPGVNVMCSVLGERRERDKRK